MISESRAIMDSPAAVARVKVFRLAAKAVSLLPLSLAIVVLAVPGAEAKRSTVDQALYEKARKACNDLRHYPDGARPVINYKGGWFRCQEPRHRRG